MIWMLVVGVCLSLSVLLVRLVWLTSYRPDTSPKKAVQQCEAALCVFQLLVDRGEEAYLRATLPQPEFRMLQRKRLWLAMRCLILLDRNATLLATTGQKAALSGDPDLAQRGERLATGALQLKVNLLAAEAAVVVKWLFPTSPLLVRVANVTVQQRVASLAGR
jgi:hypothetical protein